MKKYFYSLMLFLGVLLFSGCTSKKIIKIQNKDPIINGIIPINNEKYKIETTFNTIEFRFKKSFHDTSRVGSVFSNNNILFDSLHSSENILFFDSLVYKITPKDSTIEIKTKHKKFIKNEKIKGKTNKIRFLDKIIFLVILIIILNLIKIIRK